MDKTSLEDFLDDGSGDDSAEESGESATETGDSEPEGPEVEDPDADSPEPATTTSRWVADGVACAVCDSPAERVWESPDGLVCATCKEW